jgi:hypothetical protein
MSIAGGRNAERIGTAVSKTGVNREPAYSNRKPLNLQSHQSWQTDVMENITGRNRATLREAWDSDSLQRGWTMGRKKRRRAKPALKHSTRALLVAEYGSGRVDAWVREAIERGVRNLDAYVSAMARNSVDDGKFGAAKWGSRSVRVRISRY